jgi:hypothetical protein
MSTLLCVAGRSGCPYAKAIVPYLIKNNIPFVYMPFNVIPMHTMDERKDKYWKTFYNCLPEKQRRATQKTFPIMLLLEKKGEGYDARDWSGMKDGDIAKQIKKEVDTTDLKVRLMDTFGCDGRRLADKYNYVSEQDEATHLFTQDTAFAYCPTN